MIRILVVDTWGFNPHPRLEKMFPNVSFVPVWDEANGFRGDGNPHGHMVAQCVASLLQPEDEAEIYMYPYLRNPDATDFSFLQVAEQLNVDGICCSWGIDDGDDSMWERVMRGTYNAEHVAKVKELLGDRVMFFASGNSDKSQKRAETDNDVAWPQRAYDELENVYTIGACDIEGRPTYWSSDGAQVDAMYLGADVRVIDPATGNDVAVNGTSFAAPFACSDYFAGATVAAPSARWFEGRLRNRSSLAEGWDRGVRHPKAGLGCMLDGMQQRLFRLGKRVSKDLVLRDTQPRMMDLQILD